VNGKVTGAVFVGDGTLDVDPVLAIEKRSMTLLTKGGPLHEEFNSLVLRFTDATHEEVTKSAGTSQGSAQGEGEYDGVRNALKDGLQFGYNLDGRILQDVMSTQPGGLFYAFVKGKRFDGKELLAIDPYGDPNLRPEEVVFTTYSDSRSGAWVSEHFKDEYKTGKATGTQQTYPVDMLRQKLDTQIEKSGKLTGDATSTFVANVDGVRVVPFDLFPTLRVASVTGQDGDALEFIQEAKENDPQFYVVLPHELKKGEKYRMRTQYAGKDAVSNQGSGNLFPVARSNWYPNSFFGDYAEYEMDFHIPKSMKIAATGDKLKDAMEGDQNVTTWQSPVGITVAGFNIGNFKGEEKKISQPDYGIESFANTTLPDNLQALQNNIDYREAHGEHVEAALGNMDTTSMMKKASAEAELSIKLYTDYFGPTSFKHVAMTQQTAGNFGQSWPQLVFMPITSFLDSTVRQQLMGADIGGYFKIVGPHEVAHQWWGHTVGFESYRDQWMSEGFAEMSASLFIQMVQHNSKEFINFWNDEKQLLTDKNREGFRAIDAGPLTQGYRMANSRTGGSIPRRLIYPKGGYILHMLRMMMWNNAKGDEAFKAMMHDFVTTYRDKAATTEDFKAMVEKHMTPDMDLDGNHRMDWFFNEYVYGTGLPTYKFEQSVGQSDKGPVLNFKITQSGVDPNFKMLVPVYVEMGNGKIGRLGSATLIGNTSQQSSVPLSGVKDMPKRAILNYYDDVLAMME
jgi:hypothetical protein